MRHRTHTHRAHLRGRSFTADALSCPRARLSLCCRCSGFLSAAAATALLQAASTFGVRLSPTQLSSILSDERPSSGEYETALFVRKASLMVESLFDRASVAERSTLSVRGAVAPIALLTAADRERVEAELRGRFAEFDTNNDGALDAVEFAACLSDTSLRLSATQIESLRREVDQRDTGSIHVDAFMTFAYGLRNTCGPSHGARASSASRPAASPSQRRVPPCALCSVHACDCSQAAALGTRGAHPARLRQPRQPRLRRRTARGDKCRRARATPQRLCYESALSGVI